MSEYKKIDPEKKAKMVTALRSGEYQQCFGSLCNGYDLACSNRFCCIGVAAIANRLTVIGTTKEASECLGLSIEVMGKLIVMNDRDRMSFPDIANWIDLNL